ncbi:MAG: hypothetical protein ACI9WU_004666 [Myxococcota bacterium]|jgi:hypothetical protein
MLRKACIIAASLLVLIPVQAAAESTCGSAADCPTGLACLEVEVDCPGTAVLVSGTDTPGSEGSSDVPAEDPADTPEEPDDECEPTVEQHCWFAPCETDSDCTAFGYECTPFGGSSCSGTAIATPCACPPDDAECVCDDEPQPSPQEDCIESEEKACLPKQIACTSDDDCDNGWGCVSESDIKGEDTPPSSGSGSSQGSAGSDTPDAPPETDPVPEPEPDSGKADVGKADVVDGEEAFCLPPDLVEALPEMLANGAGGKSSENTRFSSPETTSGSDQDLAGNGAPTSGEEADDGVARSSTGSAGCSVATLPTSGALALVAFLMTVLVIRRRGL